VALLSSGPEVQYVALRNILLIIQRRPAVLKNDVKVFFCKYNDPIYVKLAKLEIMYRLARDENAREVLAELQEYVWFHWFLIACCANILLGMHLRSTLTLCVNQFDRLDVLQ
jgi:vesicle coat complex subunit